ncbi:hypothetical protein LIER_10718 [Lithospermum erythrorhizon]|uniref:Uncharacterized protein n=1 Tax=Lithospermum erythrorhizon TaxID=34254 RepID=A0AAV3PMD6_LITER
MYVAGLNDTKSHELSRILGIPLGALLVRYLGIPLVSEQLCYGDCRMLIDDIRKKIDGWGNKHFGFVGRLILINTVIFGKENYLCQSVYLPAAMVKEIDGMVRLFCGREWPRGGMRLKLASPLSLCLRRKEDWV